MNLREWVKTKFKVSRKTLPANQVALQFLRETGQAVDESTINRTIVALDDLGLLLGAPNRPGTLTRLVEVTP